MKRICLKSALKCDSFDVAIGIKIQFFRVVVTIEPGCSLPRTVWTEGIEMLKNRPSCLDIGFWFYNGRISFITGQFSSLNLNPVYIQTLKNRIAKEKQNLNLPSSCQINALSFYCPFYFIFIYFYCQINKMNRFKKCFVTRESYQIVCD